MLFKIQINRISIENDGKYHRKLSIIILCMLKTVKFAFFF